MSHIRYDEPLTCEDLGDVGKEEISKGEPEEHLTLSMAMLAIEEGVPMLALPFFHPNLHDLLPHPHPHPIATHRPSAHAAIPLSLVDITLRGLLASLDLETACRVWRFGGTLAPRVRATVFAAVIS